MPSQDKLIKAGIKYTDKLFDEISKRLEKGVKASDSLEAFLDKYHKAFPEKGNPLISLGYDKRMLDLILSETNNHRFSRPAQKELVRVTVEEKVGERIVDVGEDIKDSVRDIVRDGYNRNLSQDEIALNISNRVSVIKGKRARAIARTEIARTATVSDYVINRERGANGWYVECRNTACPVCKDRWHKSWTPEIDDGFKPSDTSAGGKGWIGDRIFSMEDTGRLPPVHPNCRCVVYYTSEEPNVSKEPTQRTVSDSIDTEFDQEKYDQLTTLEEVAEFFGLEYRPEGRKYANLGAGENVEFYDAQNDVSIRFFTNPEHKIEGLDFANSGNGYDLKRVIKNYYDAPDVLKQSMDDMCFIKGHSDDVMGDCDGHMINIYEGAFTYTGEWGRSNPQYTDNVAHSMWHEMTHALDNAIQEAFDNGTQRQRGIVNSKFVQKWIDATNKDHQFQNQNGLDHMDSSRYGEDAMAEDFAEMGATICGKLNKNNYSLRNAYIINVKDDSDRGYHKEHQKINDVIAVNPHRAKLMEEIFQDKSLNLKSTKYGERTRLIKFMQEEGYL